MFDLSGVCAVLKGLRKLKTALALARAVGELELFETKLSTAIDHHVIYPSNLEMLGSARMTWFVDAAAI
ncbi:hypothetical protein THOB06_110046 [Vibrio rotiferianus]|nr:hypothetical protein THOG10_110046 [Vibrio rotiferianus]CAH1560727.1 hypothetical protein THOB06_110046 [Vibrio rotiferianus]